MATLGTFTVANLDAEPLNLNDLPAAIRQLLEDATGIGASLLDGYAMNAQIEQVGTTQVRFRQYADISRAKAPIYLVKDGRIGVATSDPTAVTLSGGAATKYIYADISAAGVITLVSSTTAPNSEATTYRRYLGSAEWNATAITSISPHFAASVALNSTPGATFLEFAEITTPANPAADKARAYAKDFGGTTRLAYRDSAGVETVVKSDLPRSYLAGLGLANNGVDALNDIDIAVGEARSDDDAEDLALASALTKQLDVAWAVGNNAGGLDTGAEAANTWYHLWLIKRIDTNVVDVLFSASASAPTMPTNYTKKRRIGAVFNGSGSALTAFKQQGDRFRWSVPVSDIAATNPGTAAVTRALSLPAGVVVVADVCVGMNQGTSATIWGLLSALDETDSTPVAALSNFGSTGSLNLTYGQLLIKTDTSRQIRSRISASGASDTLRITTFGWIDRRGGDD